MDTVYASARVSERSSVENALPSPQCDPKLEATEDRSLTRALCASMQSVRNVEHRDSSFIYALSGALFKTKNVASLDTMRPLARGTFIVRKFFVFTFVYLLYMALVFGGMALLWKFSTEAGLTKYGLFSIFMLLLLMVLIGAPPVWFSEYYGKPSGAQKKLLQSGQEATAQILQVDDTGLSLGNSDLSYVVRLTLLVQPNDGQAPFTAQTETSISRANVPRSGETVRVKYDPKHRDKIALMDS